MEKKTSVVCTFHRRLWSW